MADKNKIKYGFENVYVAQLDLSTDNPVWEEPIHIPGAVSFSPSPEGESEEFYADNMVYYEGEANNGYSGDLTIALLPDEIAAWMLGWYIDANGMLVEVDGGEKKPFALLGQVKGDKRNRRFVYYNCTASRGSEEHTTKETTKNITPDTIPIRIKPIEVGGKNIVKGKIELNETNATAYDGFFKEVLLPSEAAQ